MLGNFVGALYCPGAPGADKTIMATGVIDYLNKTHNGTCPVLYLFCDYAKRKEQTITHFLSSLVRQATDACSSIPDTIKECYNSRGRSPGGLTDEELLSMLQIILSGFGRTYIVIDVLDEGQSFCIRRLISELHSMAGHLDVRVLGTSRFVPDVKSLFSGAVQLGINPTDTDIEAYLQIQITELETRVDMRPQLRAEIVNSVLGAAGAL